jgi:hypothetical protein
MHAARHHHHHHHHHGYEYEYEYEYDDYEYDDYEYDYEYEYDDRRPTTDDAVHEADGRVSVGCIRIQYRDTSHAHGRVLG